MSKPKKVSLRPYHGCVFLCATRESLADEYKRWTRSEYPYQDDPLGGRYVRIETRSGNPVWLIWGGTTTALVHEITHVLLHTFGRIWHNPTEGDGEPFCYMLSAIMDEALT